MKQGMYKEWENALSLNKIQKMELCKKYEDFDDIILEQDREKIELTDDYDKAQTFNDYFSIVFNIKSQNALPETNKMYYQYERNQ